MSWEQLASIAQEQREYQRNEETTRPAACYYDGEPLTEGPAGELHCRFCGWLPGSTATETGG